MLKDVNDYRANMISVDVKIYIEYKNAKGIPSHRDIHVNGVFDDMIDAYCYYKKAPKSFKFNRIKTAYELKDGANIPLSELRAYLLRFRTED